MSELSVGCNLKTQFYHWLHLRAVSTYRSKCNYNRAILTNFRQFRSFRRGNSIYITNSHRTHWPRRFDGKCIVYLKVNLLRHYRNQLFNIEHDAHLRSTIVSTLGARPAPRCALPVKADVTLTQCRTRKSSICSARIIKYWSDSRRLPHWTETPL